MNDSTKQQNPKFVGSLGLARAIDQNVFEAAEKMARTIAVARFIAPNESEGDRIEAELLRMFHETASMIYMTLAPGIQAQLAIRRAEETAKSEEK